MSASFWYCDTCGQNILHGQYRFNCIICPNYDQCESCHATAKLRHPHLVVRELAFGKGKEVENDLNNMTSFILTAFDVYADRHCFGIRDVDIYSWMTFETIGNRTKNFAHGLRNLLAPRDYLGICAANRPEWIIADFACILHSFISVPMYCRSSDREFIHVINNINIPAIICDKVMLPTFLRLSSNCPTLRHLICMDPIPDSIDLSTKKDNLAIHYMGNIEINGSLKQFEYISTKPKDCITIMHTSGTVGFPKGVMISEQSFRHKFDQVCSPYSNESVLLCYRPLAWGADRNAVHSTFVRGGRVGFATGDLSLLMEEIALVRPTSFSSSPSIWNKIYAEFKAELALAINYQKMNSKEAEEQLLEKFSKLMPNRCKIISIGGAMVSSALLQFMSRCFNRCFVIESYGSTECGGIRADDSIYSGVEYRLESVPEMGYTIDDQPNPRGELLIKSNEMFSGYINNPEETKAAMTDDGFFRTGDIVELRKGKNGRTKICVIDREKHFFKLANGEFVSPEFMQGIYLESPFIEQIYIHGDPLDNQITAVVMPNKQYTQTFTSNNPNLSLVDAIIADMHSIAAKESLGKHEIPSKIIIDFEPFTVENGLLTASLKLCRPKLAAHYANRLKNNQTIEEQLKEMFEITTGRAVTSDKSTSFSDVGGHSLAAIRLSRMIQNELGIDIPLNVLFESKMTIEELANIVRNPSRISLSSDGMLSKLMKDTEIDLNISADKQIKVVNSPMTIFFTGVTGFVGAFLLNELLTRYSSPCKLICLVKCSTTSTNGFDRLYQNMSSLYLWKEEYQNRVIVLEGDLAKQNFGLDQQTYKKLAEDTDIIFHCGAMVNSVLPYNQLYGSNVVGTREIIRLACHSSTYIPIHYISTVGVLSIDMNSPAQLRNGYAQSKWVAEQLMIKANQAGLPVAIYRLGRILSDTETGACNRKDFYTLLIVAMMQVRSYPEEAMATVIKGLPANIVARHIIDISQKRMNRERNIHEFANKEYILSFKKIIECIRICGLEMNCTPYNQWRQSVLSEKRPQSVGELLSENPFQTFNPSSQVSSSSHDNYIIKWLTFIINHILTEE